LAKASATFDFVRGAIDQGEKVIVFSCFDDPIQKLAKELGSMAVVVTGKTPGAKRQELVDRFQQDDAVRVFVANIIAGGIGLNLTAATQGVFNDLDWVPTNQSAAEPATRSAPNAAIHGLRRPDASAMAPSTGEKIAITSPAAALA
jgi:SNF2 family DNA or RNA helicase